jgi:hypothetical protein
MAQGDVALSAQSEPSDDLIRRVRGEFLEMPGLRVTPAQARRLWGLDDASCAALLATLLETEFVFRTRDGAYMRVERTARVRHQTMTSSVEPAERRRVRDLELAAAVPLVSIADASAAGALPSARR